MSLLSLSWSTAAALFGGLAVPLVALYLLKERRPVAVVPFVELWLKVLHAERARQPWLRLRRLRSLLWQLLMLAALVLALANPSFDRWTAHPRHYVAVIDASASMLAPSSDPQRWDTRLDEALAATREEVTRLGARDRAALIIAGSTVSVETNFGPINELVEATYRPVAATGSGSLADAVALARAMTANAPNRSWLRVFSDDAPHDSLAAAAWSGCDVPSTRCSWSRVGGDSENVAITAFAARRSHADPALIDLSAEVHNFSGAPVTASLRVASGRMPLRTVPLDLPAEGSERVSLRGLAAQQERFTATLHGAEGSPIPGVAYDDVAFAVVGPRARIRIAKIADRQNLFLDAVLLALDAEIDLVSMSPEEARRAPQLLAGFDLVVLDASDDAAPLPLPKTTAIFFHPYAVEDRAFPVPMRRLIRRPRISARPIDDPLVKGVVFKDVNISEATSFALDATDRPLLKHFDDAIAIARAHEDGEWIIIGFDPIRSDLPLRAAFPMIVSRVVERLRPPRENVAPRLQAGRRATVHLRDLDLDLDDGVAVEIVDDEETLITRAASREQQIDVTLPAPGIYKLVVDGQARSHLAVMGHGREESDLRAREDRTTRLEDRARGSDRAALPPWSATTAPPSLALLVLVLLSLLVEWRWFHQRRTV